MGGSPSTLNWVVGPGVTVSESGLVDPEDARLLTDAYKVYRTVVHRLTLQQQDEIVPAAEFQPLRDEVVRVWTALLGDASTEETTG